MKQPHPHSPDVRRRSSRLPPSPLYLIFFLCILLAAAIRPSAAQEADARPGPSLASLFPHRAPILLEGASGGDRGDGELARLVLPPEVLAACRADLADLRVLGPEGREIPFLLDRGPGRGAERRIEHRLEPGILAVDRERRDPEDRPPVFRESYRLTLPPGDAPAGGSWRLVIDTPRPRFVRQVVVRRAGLQGPETDGGDRGGDGGGGDGGGALARGSLFRLGGEGEGTVRRQRLELELPGWEPRPGRSLVVEISGEGDGFLSPVFRLESGRALAGPEPVRVALEVLDRRRQEERTVLELARPRGLVPESLVFRTADRGFLRPVEVWDLGPGRRETALGRDTLYSLGPERRNLEVVLVPPAGDRLRVVITDGDAPPLEELRILAQVHRPAVVLPLPALVPASSPEAPGSRSVAHLLFGGGRAQRPRYGLQALAPRAPASGEAARLGEALYDPDRLVETRLGPVEDNPRHDPRPALAFARHPGAALDPAPYRLQRQLALTPSPEGLHRLRLEPEDLAAARPDLADLRLLDGQERQWAYLLEDDADRQRLSLEVSAPSTEDRVSTYRLAPDVSPIPADRLELDSPRPFFDRPYRLHALVGREGEDRRLLASGRLTRRGEDPRPLEITFPRTRLHRLELTVEDGDDAPLEWGRVELSLPLPALYLVADPARDYRLLLGFPEGREPSYELERVRELVLAVESRPVETGPLEINPAFRRSAWWTEASGLQRIALWVALGSAVLLMVWLTLRLTRAEAGGTRGGGDGG